MPDFTDAEYLTARQKTATYNQWKRLLDADFDLAVWDKSKALYHFLTMYCGHIAHYDQSGFYAAQMGTPARQGEFLNYTRDQLRRNAQHPPPAYMDKQDISAAMLALLDEHLERLLALVRVQHIALLQAQREQIDAEIERLS